MTKEELHREVETFQFSAWHYYIILHALIDCGRVTELLCQYERCVYSTRAFIKSPRRGHPLGLGFDHIDPRRQNGSHRPENIRIVHRGCNAAWRKEIKGSFHTPESRERIKVGMAKATLEGRGRWL